MITNPAADVVAVLAALGVIWIVTWIIRVIRRDHPIITAPLTSTEQAERLYTAPRCEFCEDLAQVGDPRSCTCLIPCAPNRSWCGAVRAAAWLTDRLAAKETL